MNTHCGYIAIIGRPNVGKSTLLNCLLGQKLAITSRKPQTTRHRLLGIKTEGQQQAIFVDTPGLHLKAKTALNKAMNKAATSSLDDIDVILFVVQAMMWTAEDEWVLQKLKNIAKPILLVVNKVDLVREKALLLPFLEELSKKAEFANIYPVSAQKQANTTELEQAIFSLLPESPFLFPEDQISDRNDIFFASEIIREKLMRLLGQEIPYSLTVSIEKYEMVKDVARISAIIWVAKENHKAIIIGKDGQQLKKIGTSARLELEKFLQQKVFLQLWCKEKKDWQNDSSMLRQFGYDA